MPRRPWIQLLYPPFLNYLTGLLSPEKIKKFTKSFSNIEKLIYWEIMSYALAGRSLKVKLRVYLEEYTWKSIYEQASVRLQDYIYSWSW